MTTHRAPRHRDQTSPSGSMRRAKRWRDRKNKPGLRICAVAFVASAIAIVAAPSVGGIPAAAAARPVVTGLEKVSAVTYNSLSSKQAFAYCDPGQVVVGGGGWAFVPGSADDPNAVTLWQLQPAIRLNGTSRQGYVAGAAEAGAGVGGAWWVEAYALCADRVSGHHISDSEDVPLTSTEVQRADAFCDAGEKVLGTGARVLNTSREVGLQVARVAASGDIARAQAHEDATGYRFTWQRQGVRDLRRPSPGIRSQDGSVSRAGIGGGQRCAHELLDRRQADDQRWRGDHRCRARTRLTPADLPQEQPPRDGRLGSGELAPVRHVGLHHRPRRVRR